MNQLIEALAPAFVISLALQQLIELLDPVLEAVVKPHKKWILAAVSFILGLLLTLVFDLRIMAAIGVTRLPVLDRLMTALIVTGGTKGINDLVKFIGYKKDEVKAELTTLENP